MGDWVEGLEDGTKWEVENQVMYVGSAVGLDDDGRRGGDKRDGGSGTSFL